MRLPGFSFARLMSMLALLLLALTPLHATGDDTERSMTVETDIQSNVINADGTFVLTHELVLLINEERAIQAQAQHALSYNRTLETLEVLEAFTQKADGRKVPVRSDQIKEQQERESSEAPMFQDSLVKVVIFPEVAVGDRLVLKHKRNRATALFPGHFEDLSFPGFHATQQLTLIYDVPENLQLFADARGFTASQPQAIQGRKRYRWDYVATQNQRMELGSVSHLDQGPYLAVSTFPDFAAFASAYDARAKASVTPEVIKLSKAITAKLQTPRAKALALSDWVRKNIRYVAVYVGAGGVVPHSVDTILANRYGDCKDHVALLEALLAAAGIDSSPALINARNAYALPKVPTLGLLNHVITYIPGLNLYLDSTAADIAAGFLPLAVLDKPVLLSRTGESRLTPFAQENKINSTTLYTIDSAGAADFSYSSSIEGWAAEANRYFLNAASPAERKLWVQRAFGAQGQVGSGSIEAQTRNGKTDELEVKITGHSENMVSLPGPMGVPTINVFGDDVAQALSGFTTENTRSQAFMCISGAVEQKIRFEFRASLNILAIPKSVTVRQGGFDYTSTYTQTGNALAVHRRYEFTHFGAVCSAEDFEAMKPAIELMTGDLKSQVIVGG